MTSWRPRLAWALLGCSVVLLLTLPWAYEILRPLRDAADPNEFVWVAGCCATALAAVVVAWLPGGSTRNRVAATTWLGFLVVLLVIYVYVLMFTMDYGT